MAKILFISLNDVNAEGIRTLSAVLRHNHHEPSVIFLKRYRHYHEVEEGDWISVASNGDFFNRGRGPAVTSDEKGILLSLIEEIHPALIGFSVNSPLKKRAAEISQLIRVRFDIPILFGGCHAMMNVEECLNDCDYVCVGEGERTIVEIASLLDQKRDVKNVGNLAYKTETGVCRNPLYPLAKDLDRLPLKDISPENKFLIEDNQLTRHFNEVSYTRNLKYHVISSRGCPYDCSYCCENYFRNLYSPDLFLRRRSPAHVIHELKEAKKTILYEKVQFEDEIFSFHYPWLEEFCGLYRREIDLPFICYIYPHRDIEKNLRLLKDAGLEHVTLALQSGSRRIHRDVFHRVFDRELFLKTAHLIKTTGVKNYTTDVITFNPFEEEKDLAATLEVLCKMPKPFTLNVNKLYPIKGTQLSKMIEELENGRTKPRLSDRTFLYYSRLFWLANRHAGWFVKLAKMTKNRHVF
jgi:radical SAM superfamily enzyme YgiQ (UPF0313 family)